MTVSAAEVRPGREDDRHEAVEVLRAAFFTDPISVWLIPDGDRRRSFHRGILAAAFDDSLTGGALLVATNNDAVVGVAAWYPPGRSTNPSGEDMESAMRAMSEPDRARLQTMRRLTAEHAPADLHFYLWVMAVSPHRQGMGIGGALMRAALERCDRTQQAAHLEASSPENRDLYARYGFAELTRIDLPEGPPLYPMWRSPTPTTLGAGP